MLNLMLIAIVVFIAVLIINFVVSFLLRLPGKIHWVISTVMCFVFTLLFIMVLGL